MHYDISLPIKLACDASAYGVGAVISHLMPDSSEYPIAYASRSLSSAGKSYSQMERDALGIIFGVKKLHKFLHGHSYTLVTDQFCPAAKHGNADALSHLPLVTTHLEVFDPEVNVLLINTFPVKAARLKTATDEDRVIAKV